MRALYPSRTSLVRRTGVGPQTLAELRTMLAATRRRGWSEEDSEVTEGFASVAVRLNSPSNLAAVAVTWQSPLELEVELVLDRLRAAAATIEARLR